jgi:spermidine synthase
MQQQAWQQTNLAAIAARLAWLKQQPDGVVHDERSPLHHIRIIKHAGQVHFYFRDPTSGVLAGPMSRIDLDRPLDLLAEYTQAAMLALLWRPEPERVCIIGLAGGRLSMILHHHLPRVVIDNVDVDPAVAEIAARYFGIAFDARQTFAIQDGRSFLAAARASYDIIVMDAFRDETDNLDHLATAGFYALCKARLARGGVLCANLLKSDALFLAKTKTLLACFRHVGAVEHKRGVVLFGSDHHKLAADEIARRSSMLQRQYGFEFPFLARAAALKPARDLPFYPSLRGADILNEDTAPARDV